MTKVSAVNVAGRRVLLTPRSHNPKNDATRVVACRLPAAEDAEFGGLCLELGVSRSEFARSLLSDALRRIRGR
jgi:hypothetical protein